MKVICTVTNDLNSDQRMIRTCETLVARGHEVWLVGRKRKESAPLKNRKFSQHRFLCFFQKGKLFYLEYNLRLWWYLGFAKTDVLCSVDLDTAMPALMWSPFKNWKWIIDAHEWFPFVPEVERRKTIQKIWLWVEARCIPKADAVYTVGSAIAEGLALQYKREVKVVRNAPLLSAVSGVNGLPPNIELPNEDFLLYQGALNEGRGLERLLEVLTKVNIHLVLVGSGDIEERLKQLVMQLNLGSRVHFLGFVSPEYLPFITQKAKVGYNVSEPISRSYELSLNNKFFDYVHAELPSVINDFVEYRNLCNTHEVGILVNPENDEIIRALEQLFNDNKMYEHCKRECVKAKKTWNWEQETLQLIPLFEY